MATKLPTATEKRIAKAAEKVARGNPDKQKRCYRWAAKAYKQAKKIRKTPMVPGEDGLTDKERDAMIADLPISRDWADQHKHELGYTRTKTRA